MKKQSIHISIPTPCHESWDAMDASAEGAFCHSCQKEVIDFSAMTDKEVIEYLAKHKTGCGRFRKDQVDTRLTVAKIESGIFTWRSLLLGFLSFISLEKTLAHGNNKPAQILPAETADSTKSAIIRDTIILNQINDFSIKMDSDVDNHISVVLRQEPVYEIIQPQEAKPIELMPMPGERYAEAATIAGGVYISTPQSRFRSWIHRVFGRK